jgi:outer membrane protein assembly factor BamB
MPSDAVPAACRHRRRLGAATLVAVVVWVAGCDPHDIGDPNRTTTADVIWQAALPALGPPALDASSVYFSLRDHRIAALDRETGAVRWIANTRITGTNLVTQDVPVRVGTIVAFGDLYLFGYDAASGKERWVFGTAPPDSDPPGVGIYPFVADTSHIFAGSAVGVAYAIDAETGAQLWRADLMPGEDHQVRIAAVRGGTVWLNVRYEAPEYIAYHARLYALDATSGQTIWTFELARSGPRGNSIQDVALTDGPAPQIVASFADGRVVALDGASGAPLTTIPAPPNRTATDDTRILGIAWPLVVASTTAPDALQAWDLTTGTAQWATASDRGSIVGRDALAIDRDLAVACYITSIGAYDIDTGLRRWLRVLPDDAICAHAPLTSGDTMFVGGWTAAYAIRR